MNICLLGKIIIIIHEDVFLSNGISEEVSLKKGCVLSSFMKREYVKCLVSLILFT